MTAKSRTKAGPVFFGRVWSLIAMLVFAGLIGCTPSEQPSSNTTTSHVESQLEELKTVAIESSEPVIAADPMDWLFWRGPEFNGVSRETGLIDDFDPRGGDDSVTGLEASSLMDALHELVDEPHARARKTRHQARKKCIVTVYARKE